MRNYEVIVIMADVMGWEPFVPICLLCGGVTESVFALTLRNTNDESGTVLALLLFGAHNCEFLPPMPGTSGG